MLFLNEEERRFVLRKLLPDSRRNGVHDELRGWRWADAPIAPTFEVPLGVSDISNGYCETHRDLYLRRVAGARATPNQAMVEGRLLHKVVAGQLLRSIKTLYANEVAGVLDALELDRSHGLADTDLCAVTQEERPRLLEKASALAEFERHRIVARVGDVLARQPRVTASGLAALAIPVTVELPMDGRFLGLSSHLSADAVSLFEPTIMDLKFGPKRDFHRLATAGYALVMESLHEFPVNLGCVVYGKVEAGRVTIQRDFHLIDDELRQWFLETRDEAMRMVCEEIEPGRPAECQADCPYRTRCGG